MPLRPSGTYLAVRGSGRSGFIQRASQSSSASILTLLLDSTASVLCLVSSSRIERHPVSNDTTKGEGTGRRSF